MKLPNPGLSFRESLKSLSPKSMGFQIGSELHQIIEKANTEYLGWHKFRYQPFPEGVSPPQAWAYLKLSRWGNRLSFGLGDVKGKPFSYWLPNAFRAHLHEIDIHGGGEIGMAVPAAREAIDQRYLVSSLMEEAIASSQIEGASTLRKVAKEMLRTGRKPRNHSEQMILNNYRVMTRMKEFCKQDMSLDLLCEMQAVLTEDTLDPDEVGRIQRPGEERVRVIMDDEILHEPPPAEELLGRMEALCAYANKKFDITGHDFEHPVIRAILLHFRLGYDHPFVDGNGRTARALFHWYVMKQGYWLFEYLPISRIIRKATPQYLRAYWLSEQDDNDVTYFVAFHLRAIRLALRNMWNYIEKKQRDLQLRVNTILSHLPFNLREEALITHALKHPGGVYTAISHSTSCGVSFQTARSDLRNLESYGFLRGSREGRRNVWIAPIDLRERLGNFGSSPD